MLIARISALLIAAVVAAGCVIHTPAANRHRRRRQPRSHQPPPPPPAPPAKTLSQPPPPAQPALPPQRPRQPPPRSRTRPELLPAGIGAGRPASFRPGAPAAYWIWQGPRGDWRLRTTTTRLLHAFRGHVKGTTGAVLRIQPSRTEFRDRVWKTKTGWAFSFTTMGHADGFTFATRDNGCVRFDLLIDGGPHPKRIFVGRAERSPSQGHFIVCPKGATPTRAR